VRILVTGATGLIGRALVPVLQRDHHSIIVWSRSAARARGRLGADIEALDGTLGQDALVRALRRVDAVVNLAGEPLMPGRWSAARRQRIWDSRVRFTSDLVRAIEAAPARPRVLVSSSAVGYYGDRGSDELTEESAPGRGFLAELCQEWEAAARAAEPLGLRVVALRTGVVLGRDGGALAAMLPGFRLGAGGAFGSGRQFVPWIHLHDLVAIVAAAIADDRIRGPVNGVAPEPVTSRQFAACLGRSLGRPAVIPMPAAALRLVFGEVASVLLRSQRVEPSVLKQLGFRFVFPMVTGALADIIGGPAVEITRLRHPIEDHGSASGRRYLNQREPIYDLRMRTVASAPLEETFAFFSKAENLGLLTPAAMRFSVHGTVPAIAENTAIDYRLRVGPVPVTWRSRIVDWVPGVRFVDYQEKGPYRSWWHEHRFEAQGNRTVMEDRVSYAPPLGLVGRLINRLFIVPTLRRIFRYRADVIRLRFGGA
jgi:uncharacterized protein (TIGR01777 family)